MVSSSVSKLPCRTRWRRPLRLVGADLEEAVVLVVRRAALGDDQGAPEAQLDLAADVMTNRRLVEALQVAGEGRHDDVAHAAHVLPGPVLRFALRVLHLASHLRGAAPVDTAANCFTTLAYRGWRPAADDGSPAWYGAHLYTAQAPGRRGRPAGRGRGLARAHRSRGMRWLSLAPAGIGSGPTACAVRATRRRGVGGGWPACVGWEHPLVGNDVGNQGRTPWTRAQPPTGGLAARSHVSRTAAW